MTEQWRNIDGFPGYDVSDMGRVRSYWKWSGPPNWWTISSAPQRFLTGGARRYGHLWVTLSDDEGRKVQRGVHQLVLEAFVGPVPDGMETCHNDGNPTNNSLANLRYDTHRENTLDMVRHGTYMPESDVVAIRERYASGDGASAIARAYGISTSHVTSICNGECYTPFGGPITKNRKKPSSLTVDDLAYMIQLRESGLSYRYIGERFGVSESYVCYIFQGKRLAGRFEQARSPSPAHPAPIPAEVTR